MKILVLDDMHQRFTEFKKRFRALNTSKVLIEYDLVETAEECINMLRANDYNYVFLDHDLGGEAYVSHELENTGSGVARWISKSNKNKNSIYIVHSLNPVGAAYMVDLIRHSDRVCVHIPGAWLTAMFPISAGDRKHILVANDGLVDDSED